MCTFIKWQFLYLSPSAPTQQCRMYCFLYQHIHTWSDVYNVYIDISLLFAVIESHPDNALEDLRLDQPFAEFKDHLKSYDLDRMDKKVCTWLIWVLHICQFKLLEFYTPRCSCVPSLSHLQDHSHTPWIIIVAKYLEKWLSEVQCIFSASSAELMFCFWFYILRILCTVKCHFPFHCSTTAPFQKIIRRKSPSDSLYGEVFVDLCIVDPFQFRSLPV